ncbi:hypothetical protein [Nostoc sp.]
MKNGYLLITYYLLLITPESPCVNGGEDVNYGCYLEAVSKITYSSAHKNVGVFTFEEVKILKMPEGYKRSIQKWSKIFAFQILMRY